MKKRKQEVFHKDIKQIEPIAGWLLVCDDFPQFDPDTPVHGWGARVGKVVAAGVGSIYRDREAEMIVFDDAGRDNFLRVDERHALLRTERVIAFIGLPSPKT